MCSKAQGFYEFQGRVMEDDQRFGLYSVGDFVQVEGMLSVGMVVGIEATKLLIGYKNTVRKVEQAFLGATCYKVEKPIDFDASDLEWIYTQYPHLATPNTPIAK